MIVAAAISLSTALLLFASPAPARLAPFSSAVPGQPPPAPWRVFTLPKQPLHTRYEIVALEGGTVLRATAEASYANLVHPLSDERAQRLRWRWRVERPVEGSDLTRKDGDDVPARVCALFDVPLERLHFGDRLIIILARALFNVQLPAAAICYVWDRELPPGTWLANAYTDRVQMLVLRRGRYGNWFEETRDLASDFVHAFPYEARGGVAPLAAIGLSADADNTGRRALAYFGDLVLEGR